MKKYKLVPQIRSSLIHIGEDIQIARKKRRLPQKNMAVYMGVSVSTLQRLEAGDPGVSIHTFITAFAALGSLDRFYKVFDMTKAESGLLSDRCLPSVNTCKNKTTASPLTGRVPDQETESFSL